MSLNNPTTAELTTAISSGLQAQLNEQTPLPPKSFTQVLSRVLSGVVKILYNYGSFNALQQYVRTASFAQTEINGRNLRPLVEWGVLVGIGQPTQATQAELNIDIPVISQQGSLPAGTALVSSVNGITYLTTDIVLLTAATVTATVRAAADSNGTQGAGSQGNLDNGATLSFVNPIGSVGQNATVTGTSVQGADGESEAAYRQRILDRFQKRPQGGAYADYEAWAEEVAGIINAYPYTDGTTPNIVNVYCEATEESSGSTDGIPTAAQLQDVVDSINLDLNGLATRRPVSVIVNALAITRAAFNVNVQGLSVPTNLGQVQTDINTSIKNYLLDAEPFISGLTVGRRKDRITQASMIGIVEDIVNAAGGTFTTLTMELAASPGSIASHTLGEGEKAKLNGNVTYS